MTPKHLLAAAIVMLAFISCRKTEIINPGTGNQVILNIPLAENYLSAAEIDSAIVSWETVTETQFHKITGIGETLKADLSAFRKGDGTLTIQIFTKKQLNGQPLQYEKRMNGRLSHQDAIFISGPSSITDPAWNPRVFMSYELAPGRRYTGIVGLRVSDPYFEIKHLAQGYAIRLKVFRGFYKTGEQTLIVGKTWDSQGNPPVNQVNRQFFLSLPQDLNNADWQTEIIEVTFYDSPSSGAEFAFVFNKP